MLDTSRNQNPSIPSVASMKNPRRKESTNESEKAPSVVQSGIGGKYSRQKRNTPAKGRVATA